jgi:hypothetical protein
MAVICTRCTKDSQLKQILSLQQRNLISNVSPYEKEKEGFVTVSHTLQQLADMNSFSPHIIALDQEKVVGYALCMHPRFGDDIKVLKPMFLEIATVVPKTESFIVMGHLLF